MSQEEAATGTTTADENAQDGEQKQDTAADSPEQRRQEAWAARRALIAHAPDFVSTLINRDQFGQTGGHHYGDTIYHFGGRADAPRSLSGPIPKTDVDMLAAVFQDGPSFQDALTRLRTDRLVFLSGGHETGRRSAALMLLHRLGVDRMRSLDPHTSVSALPDQLDSPDGYLLCDLAISRNRPLQEPHLLALREQLERTGARLVITVEPSAALGDIPSVRWEAPSAEDILRSHVTQATGEAAWTKLCGLTPVKDFLTQQHRPREIERFAQRLVALHRGEIDEERLAAYGETAVAAQVTRWLTGEKPELRDKAFLISLAVFDKAPYAVTAELSDSLFARLQKIEDPAVLPRIPVFGSSREERLRLARAAGYIDTQVTEWGPLEGQYVAAFREERTARILLEEVWNLHPSARPALVEWIHRLAEDRRPLVRTRAASAAARLAHADLPSAMAHFIEPWAEARNPNSWLTAANALTMAQLLSVPTILQILHHWCTDEHDSRRWTAIRAFGLLGPVHHEAALAALLDAIHQRHQRHRDDVDRDDEDAEDLEEEALQFAEALQLLLLAVREPVLTALAERLHDRAVRAHALFAFLQACEQHEDDNDRPLVLDWYAQALANDDTETARYLTSFWQEALSDRGRTAWALRILRGWVLKADHDPASESALASLLPALVAAPPNHRRVSHLLRTVRHSDREPSPAAERLLTRIS
ncbi:hypothetical protein [Streptomyces curacoi]|uniref:Aromatic ring-opening dioxygenase LigA n=1 Tax=Streptomyces curacoi TaxID=146536 RepID=A0A117P6Q7_9ACTN|nr:hypothetical protein [Streptomyces curacoi]KUM74079.1 hypothetical protein AQI70_19235 [Streptomyces curacoi]